VVLFTLFYTYTKLLDSIVMALTTYILLSALHAGRAGTFDPQILGQTASKAFGLLFLEFLCIKLGCYLLGIGEEGAVVDLIAYEGYKFVGWVALSFTL
jgi:protein transport protein YIF1